LRDELAALETSFKSVWDHKLNMEHNFNAQQAENNRVVEELRAQVSGARNVLSTQK
jgi:hypothetical protein